MQVSIESAQPGITVIHLAESLEMSSVAAFRQTLQKEVKGAERAVVLVFAEVRFIDSSGIAVLIEGLRWSRERNLIYILANLTPDVQMVFELARLENFFTIVENLDAALTLIAEGS